MRLSLSQVPVGGCAVAFTLPPEALRDAGEGVGGAEPVQVSGHAELEAGGLRVRGTLDTRLQLTCSRCLEVFPFPVRSRFDVTYSTTVPVEDEVELGTRELTVAHLEGDAVDLAEMAHEQVMLEIPMAPLCRPDCRGLCPACGANLNDGPCGCARPADNPRFAALRKLKLM